MDFFLVTDNLLRLGENVNAIYSERTVPSCKYRGGPVADQGR